MVSHRWQPLHFSLFTLIFMCKPQSLERLISWEALFIPTMEPVVLIQHPAELYSGHHFPFGRTLRNGLFEVPFRKGVLTPGNSFASDHQSFERIDSFACSLDLRGSEVKACGERDEAGVVLISQGVRARKHALKTTDPERVGHGIHEFMPPDHSRLAQIGRQALAHRSAIHFLKNRLRK